MEFFFGALLFNFSSIEYAFSAGIFAKFASVSKLFPIHEAVFPKNEIYFIFTKKNKLTKNYIIPKLDLADPNELFESVRRSLALESKGSVSGSFRLSYNFGNKKYL